MHSQKEKDVEDKAASVGGLFHLESRLLGPRRPTVALQQSWPLPGVDRT